MRKVLSILLITISVSITACAKEGNSIQTAIPTEAAQNTTSIEESEAIMLTKENVSEEEKETISNYEDPEVEVMTFEEEPSIYKYDGVSDLTGKEAYKITYTTNQDGLLGPIVFYVGKDDGVVYGTDFRE